MGQIFPRNANLFVRVSIFAGLLGATTLILLIAVFFRSNAYRQVNVAIEQPVPYSHQLHVDVLGIDCRYCHVSVEQSYFANIPATETCMTCHSQIKTESPDLAPVRASYASGDPVLWEKVNRVPDFVYFNHSIHVNKGVGCSTCHGRVDQMPVVWQTQAFFMGFCLDCHRNPENYVRPLEEVYNMEYVHPANQRELGAQLVAQYGIMPPDQLTNCWTCHR
ncbi:cytochrome c3 family protein [Candidatus Viridilinea mediisalina]|uniref:Cytochrome C n=1 Tax=Candidatus Viridilinea mediisalina TaxID=2024553 RepID=A0A2A6RM42_9CHLR|nr:cytochrome c3 family protein [Candidatus Viridilinea mediisalina]PDW03995.1 cytochrome C [Candidatus Viridilinea mediisalina]